MVFYLQLMETGDLGNQLGAVATLVDMAFSHADVSATIHHLMFVVRNV